MGAKKLNEEDDDGYWDEGEAPWRESASKDDEYDESNPFSLKNILWLSENNKYPSWINDSEHRVMEKLISLLSNWDIEPEYSEVTQEMLQKACGDFPSKRDMKHTLNSLSKKGLIDVQNVPTGEYKRDKGGFMVIGKDKRPIALTEPLIYPKPLMCLYAWNAGLATPKWLQNEIAENIAQENKGKLAAEESFSATVINKGKVPQGATAKAMMNQAMITQVSIEAVIEELENRVNLGLISEDDLMKSLKKKFNAETFNARYGGIECGKCGGSHSGYCPDYGKEEDEYTKCTDCKWGSSTDSEYGPKNRVTEWCPPCKEENERYWKENAELIRLDKERKEKEEQDRIESEKSYWEWRDEQEDRYGSRSDYDAETTDGNYTIASVFPHPNGKDVIIKYRCVDCEDIITVIKNPPTTSCHCRSLDAESFNAAGFDGGYRCSTCDKQYLYHNDRMHGGCSKYDEGCRCMGEAEDRAEYCCLEAESYSAESDELEESKKRTKMSAIRTGLAITTFGIVMWNLWTNKKQEKDIADIMDLV